MAPILSDLLGLPAGKRADLAITLWESLSDADREAALLVDSDLAAELDRRWAERRESRVDEVLQHLEDTPALYSIWPAQKLLQVRPEPPRRKPTVGRSMAAGKGGIMRAVVRWLFVPPLLYGLLYLVYQISEQPRERRHAVRTPAVADALLRLARVGPEDLIYDLECGDGTLVLAAAQQRGTRSVCLDTFPRRIRDVEARAEDAGVRSLIQFNVQDWRDIDLSPATVVVLFSPVQWHYSLRGQLTQQLRPGTRIVSYLRDLGGWEPAEVVVLATSAHERGVPLMLWIADGKYRPKGLGEVRPASIPDVWGSRSGALRTNTPSQ